MITNTRHTRRRVAASVTALLLVATIRVGAQTAAPVAVIPMPASAVPGTGAWVPPATVVISTNDARSAELKQLAGLAADIVWNELGRAATVRGGRPSAAGIHLRLDAARPGSGTSAESYRLVVSPVGVEISAAAGAGLFYGLQTLRQLIQAQSTSQRRIESESIAAVTIDDAPRFPYRGLHLDVGRHFFPASFVKRYIELMSRYKLNTFHWHLTEDQGWRIEITKYPRLTSVGGCRRETMLEKNFQPYVGDGVPYCGSYTQDEVRDVVRFAQAHYVTIIPEIEMPGHSKAALAAYPELGCTAGPFEVRTTWGVDDDILCPSDRTFQFVEDVLGEVIALFPGRYVHIGGDEAPKTRWKASLLAQDLIKREGLKDEHELQSYFIRRVEQFLLRNNRRLIGWDEILEGGLAPQATVMSWRGIAGGMDAARQGRDVIMTPNSHLYLDFYQGDARFEPMAIGGLLPLERVYSYEPLPDSLTPTEQAHILGAQGNVWTEYLATTQAVEFMAYPRALALAEVTWSPRAARSWASFTSRLPSAMRGLSRSGVYFRVPEVQGLEGDQLTLQDKVTVRLSGLFPGAEIRYTIDGSDPGRSSSRYAAPVEVAVPAGGVRVAARAFTSEGWGSPVRWAFFTRTTYRDAERLADADLATGLRYEYFEGAVRNLAAIDARTPARNGTVAGAARKGDERAEQYALRLSGFLRVPMDGLYTFGLSSDDGSGLWIGDAMVVNNDGFHGAEEKTGMIALRAGLHPITVRYFQGGGGAELSLRYRTGDGAWQPVPNDWFRRTP